MKIEFLETPDIFDPPVEIDEISDEDPQEAEISCEEEKYVMWQGHYVTPDALFEEFENLALNADPKTAYKIQDVVERLAQAAAEGISETNRLLLMRDIEVLAGSVKTEQGTIHYQCGKKRGWLGEAAHKVTKFVKKHKVAIIVGIVVIATIITVAILVSGPAAEAVGVAGAGGEAAIKDDEDEKKKGHDTTPERPSQKS